MAKSTQHKLTLVDRILIQQLLQAKGSYTQLIVRDEIKRKVQLTQDEITNYQVKTDDKTGFINWNKLGADALNNFAITELEKIELSSALKELDTKKELTAEMLPLYKKFCK